MKFPEEREHIIGNNKTNKLNISQLLVPKASKTTIIYKRQTRINNKVS